MTPAAETSCQHPDEENTSLEPDNPTQCIVVTQEMDQNAGRKHTEVYQNPVVCNESEGDISLEGKKSFSHSFSAYVIWHKRFTKGKE